MASTREVLSAVADGAQERRDAHALGAYLLQVTPTEIHRAEPFEDEFLRISDS